MEWQDHGIILSARRHGENNAIVESFSLKHGRCLGLVQGARSRQKRPILQSGNFVQLVWRARLEEHLGHFTIEPLKLYAGCLMENRLTLSALTSLLSLAQTLPEREPHENLYEALHIVLTALENNAETQATWPALMVRWELGLLEELGFGLDLSRCAATGSTENLAYVSPRTGRAVSFAAGQPYHNRLLALPRFLQTGEGANPADVIAGFMLTGYFLQRHIFEPRKLLMPEARHWLVTTLAAKEEIALDIPKAQFLTDIRANTAA